MDLGGYFFWLGASADADPALVASDQAASRLAPTGFDPSRKEECVGCGLKLEPGEWGYCSLKCMTMFDPRFTEAKL